MEQIFFYFLFCEIIHTVDVFLDFQIILREEYQNQQQQKNN